MLAKTEPLGIFCELFGASWLRNVESALQYILGTTITLLQIAPAHVFMTLAGILCYNIRANRFNTTINKDLIRFNTTINKDLIIFLGTTVL